jgi:alcohol dehydrogenase (NADP+)
MSSDKGFAGKTLHLNNGVEMPVFGLGTWQSKPGEVAKSVEAALRLGYRHIDCAHIYGNEEEVGEVFERLFNDPSSGIRREDVWVTSKLWNTSHQRDRVRPALEKTLKNLRIKYLDQYLIHMPTSHKPLGAENDVDKYELIKVPLRDTWEGMEECYEAKLARSIGVSNFPGALLHDLLSYCRIPPAVNQIERHPYLVQPELVEYCQRNNIQVVAYSPLGSKGTDPSKPVLLDDPLIEKIASKYKRSKAQVLLNWSLVWGMGVIPKSVNEERLKENMGALDFRLEDQDVKALDGLNKNVRYVEQKFTKVPIFW